MERRRKGGWALLALDLGVDTTTPAGEMMANSRHRASTLYHRLYHARLTRNGRVADHAGIRKLCAGPPDAGTPEPAKIDDLHRRHLKLLKASDDVMDMGRGTTSAAAQGTGVLGFTIVLLTFLSQSLIPAPDWIWWVALAAGVLLAVKDGIGAFAVAALVVAGFMVVGPLLRSMTSPPDLEEPIPVPSGYGFEQVSTGRSQSQVHVYVSKTLVNRDRAAREGAREVLQYYVGGLTKLGWTDVGSDDRNAIFRAPGSDSGIWIMVNLVEPAPSVGFEPGDFTLGIQISNCPSEDSCGPRFAD